MKELLERYGYSYVGNCNCDGFTTQKYKRGDFQLRVRTGKNLIKIKKGGHSITQWVPIDLLPIILENTNAALQQS